MNENVAALLRIDDAQLTNFSPVVSRNVQQSTISHLTAHLGVERRAINNDIYFVRLFAEENGFNDCFRLEKVVTEKFRRRGFQLSFFDTDFLPFLSLACALALLLHQLLESNNIDSQAALPRHQF